MKRLVVNFGRVGDLVMLTPLLRHLARSGEVDLLTRPWGCDLLEGSPFLRRVSTLEKPYRGHVYWTNPWRGWRLSRMAQEIRDRRYDEVLMSAQEFPSMRMWVRATASGSDIRELRRSPADDHAHPLSFQERMLAECGYDTAGFDPIPNLEVFPEARDTARSAVARLGKRVLGIQPGSSMTHRWFRKQPNLKGLQTEQWVAAIETLMETQVDAVVIHGSRFERREARAIRSGIRAALRPRVHDWTGLSLRELPGALQAMSWLITVDTGPAHIAAAVGCPQVVLFGPSDPLKWKPCGSGAVEVLLGKAPCQYCMDTGLFKTCRKNLCLMQVSTAQIVASFQNLRMGAATGERIRCVSHPVSRASDSRGAVP